MELSHFRLPSPEGTDDKAFWGAIEKASRRLMEPKGNNSGPAKYELLDIWKEDNDVIDGETMGARGKDARK